MFGFLRKITCIALVFALVFCFFSCGNNKADESKDVLRIDENYYNGEYVDTEKSYSDTDGLTVALPAPESGSKYPVSLPENALTDLKALLDSQIFECAMFYMDIESGLTVSYNADRLFGAASLVKAPYLLYILQMVEEGTLSLDEEHTYQSKYHKFGGTGKVQNMPDGTVLTLKQIIEYIVLDSDNTAFKMLYNTSGTSGGVLSLSSFHSKAKKEYSAPFLSGSTTVLTAGGVARMFNEIYKRSLTSELFEWYIGLLKQANENVFIKNGIPKDENGNAIYEVAHKYGMDIRASNDAAIVFYGDRPYILVVLTDYLLHDTWSFVVSVSEKVFTLHEYVVTGDESLYSENISGVVSNE